MIWTRCRGGLRTALACMLLSYACVVQSEPEPLKWLKRIQFASQKLSYSGTVVYQQGDRTETSRITHLVDGHEEIEKIEFMDGMPREILRTNDLIRCYLPESRSIRLERRSDQRSFPAILPKNLEKLAENYEIALGENRRIAGFNCREVILKPKDDLRYGYRICGDLHTAMLLRARTVDSRGATVEQFTFAQLRVGSVERDQIRTSFSAHGWSIEDSLLTPANFAEAGWSMPSTLPGFAKVLEVRRRFHDSPGVGQVVYSDGIAAVSVFLEPLQNRREPVRTGLTSIGASNLYTRHVANHLVTVVGEMPPGSVARMAETVRYSQTR